MKRKVFIIGIGAGNPEHVTVQAIDALNAASVFFIPNKGSEKEDLARLRHDICERFLAHGRHRMVDFDTPARDASNPAYGEGVKQSFDLEHEAIPGISSVQALAAAHKIPLNRIGEFRRDHDRPQARCRFSG